MDLDPVFLPLDMQMQGNTRPPTKRRAGELSHERSESFFNLPVACGVIFAKIRGNKKGPIRNLIFFIIRYRMLESMT
jgi:hypothetical protein